MLLNATQLLGSALAILVAGSFAADAALYFKHAKGEINPQKRRKDWMAVAGNLFVLLLIIILQKRGVYIALSISIGLRIFGIAYNILTSPTGRMDRVSEDLMESLQLSDNP